jgi:hypothetical protein
MIKTSKEKPMRTVQAIAAVAVAAALAGCASSVSAPTPVQSLSAEQKASLHLSDFSADAANGVEMGDTDFDNVCQKVRAYVQQEAPTVLAGPAGAATYKMKIHFTRFDRGNAFARFMLIGLGQIRIEGTVDLVDAGGASVAEYKVSKDFAIGGVVGATTSVDDVEDGFAKSVAEIVRSKA